MALRVDVRRDGFAQRVGTVEAGVVAALLLDGHQRVERIHLRGREAGVEGAETFDLRAAHVVFSVVHETLLDTPQHGSVYPEDAPHGDWRAETVMRAVHGELKLLSIVGSELEVDDHGRVWRIAARRAGQLRPAPRHRAEFRNHDGYARISGNVGGERIRALAHRLVWARSNGAIPDGMEVNHKDGDKSNNRLDNLEIVTPSQNSRHALAVLGRTRARGSRHPRAILNEQSVRAIRERVSAGEDRKIVAASFGIARATVDGIVCRSSWRHVT